MNKALFFNYMILVFVLFNGCDTKDPNKYLEILNNEHKQFCQKIERNGYKVRVYYRPLDYFIAKEVKEKEVELSKKDIKRVKEIYNKAHYFVLNIGPADSVKEEDKIHKDIIFSKLTSMENYSDNLKEKLFGMGRKMFIKTSENDTIYPTNYHLDRAWGIHKNHSFLVTFPIVFNNREISFKTDVLYIKDFGINVGTFKVLLNKYGKKKFKI